MRSKVTIIQTNHVTMPKSCRGVFRSFRQTMRKLLRDESAMHTDIARPISFTGCLGNFWGKLDSIWVSNNSRIFKTTYIPIIAPWLSSNSCEALSNYRAQFSQRFRADMANKLLFSHKKNIRLCFLVRWEEQKSCMQPGLASSHFRASIEKCSFEKAALVSREFWARALVLVFL